MPKCKPLSHTSTLSRLIHRTDKTLLSVNINEADRFQELKVKQTV